VHKRRFGFGKEVYVMVEEVASCPLTRGQRILVALDGSQHSDKALEQAISMAKVCNSELFATTVIDLYPEVLEIAPALQEKLSKEAREILDRAKERAEQENISCETIVHVGWQFHEYIVQEAKKREADLIVMGTQGKTGLKKLIVGSVAQRVLGARAMPRFGDAGLMRKAYGLKCRANTSFNIKMRCALSVF
jgi:nucleotide-binding universal stress UspA family protein